jgi:hypothetical protein
MMMTYTIRVLPYLAVVEVNGDAVGEVRRGGEKGWGGPCWQRKEDTEQDRGI